MVLKALMLMMALNFPGLFGDGGLMQASANDGETGLFSGSRMIPGGRSAFSASILDISAGTFANDAAVGTANWINESNAQDEDGIYATVGLDAGITSVNENSIKMVKGGSVVGNDKSTGALVPGGLVYVGYGGSSDLWGVQPSPDDVNSATFGVAFSVKDPDTTSKYLKVTNWGFNIPTDSTIVGVLAEIKQQHQGGAPTGVRVDHFRMTVYYLPGVI